MTLRLGIVGTLPAVDTGPADHLSYLAPALAGLCRLTVYVPDVAAVTETLRGSLDVRGISDLREQDVDILVYQVANNPEQQAVNDAAHTGPPGLLEIHDGSQHHNLAHLTQQRGLLTAYREAMVASHGEEGGRLADLRGIGPGFQLEHVVFDALAAMLRRHRGAIVHNHWAAALVERRCPETPTWLAPNPAPPPRVAAPVDRAALGLPEDAYVIGNFGFVTYPKRPLLLFDAFAELCRRGVNAFLVYGGSVRDGFLEAIRDRAAAAGLTDRVMLTGYLERQRLNALLDAVDVVFNCRFPQLGESSGVMAEAMAAGKPLLVHPVGAWADVPETVVVRVQMGTQVEEVAAVVDGLERLRDPGLRDRMGAAARDYAAEHLSVDAAARAVVAAAQDAVQRRLAPMAERVAAAQERARLTLRTLDDDGARTVLDALRPSLTDAALLVLGEPAWAGPARTGLGYTVTTEAPPEAGPLGQRSGTFDAVVVPAHAVLEHPDPWWLLAEANRVLGETGTLVVGVEPAQEPALRRLLDATGFDAGPPRPSVVVASKAALPGERWPADLYAGRWLARVAAGSSSG